MKSEEGLIFSPTDLIRFMESPFAIWMERYRVEHPGKLKPDPETEETKLIAETGNRHEAKFLETLRAAGRDICEIERKDPPAESLTLAAIKQGRQIIYQGCLALPPFRGFTDFLVREEGGPPDQIRYEIWDTKLARKPKPYYLIQLCCYAEMLAAIGGELPHKVRVVLGNGEIPEFNTADYFHYYLQLKAAFLKQMKDFDPARPPEPDPRADHGRWASHAEARLIETDHLVRIANISVGQIKKLQAAGITTMRQLAASAGANVPRMPADVMAALVEQAQLQVATEDARKGAKEGDIVPARFRVVLPDADQPRRGLATLPPASPQDIYFDMEGFPLVDGGLEYLFGATHEVDGKLQFVDWWAHDAMEEKTAFEGFIDWAYARWKADPAMHIYHYAAYEVSAVRRLMGRYATREDQVDDLLRAGVFVDLYQVVRQGLRVGEESYSIKYIEHLYRPQRAGTVATAGESMVHYANWIESGQSRDWRESPILRGIRDYNRDDCESTLQLAAWLRDQQARCGIAYLPPLPPPQPEAEKAEENEAYLAELHRLTQSLDQKAQADKGTDREVIHVMLRDLLEFYRREDKPAWWRLFERETMTHQELKEDLACVGDAELISTQGTKDKKSLIFRYRFDPTQDTKLAVGDTVMPVENRDVKFTITAFSEEGELGVKLGEATLNKKLGGRMPARTSFLPQEVISSVTLRDALHAVATQWEQQGAITPALAQFFRRKAPTIVGHQNDQPLRAPGEDIVKAAVRIAAGMQTSTLCLQGPPGTGKTTTAAFMIKALLGQGKRVGVTSNSHKAILNLLRSCNTQLQGTLSGIKVGTDPADPFFVEAPRMVAVETSTTALATYQGGVVAGTAWLFARPDWIGQLDYLFVDEAGQVSVANLTAMSRSTTNIVLLGDQMQLEQPTQGSHPGESGLSVLNYYLRGHATIPDSLGLFLPESRRMHPEVCRFVSDLAYEGRLKASPGNERRRLLPTNKNGVLDAIEAGIIFDPMVHDGNVQASDEEVARVVELASQLVGRELTDRDGRVTGKLSWADILFVAPYNMQVRKLRAALPADARVGSVDKFQGQEAPVVFVSMCSSYGEYGSRGIEFILDPNRMNVAISRAQVLAVVVGDPRIALTPAGNIPGMRRLNLYCRLIQQCQLKHP